MSAFKYLIISILLLGCGPAVYAQGQFLRPLVQRTVAKPSAFEQALRAGGQAYIVANMRLGQEALTAGMLSRVGLETPTFKDQLKCRAYEFCAARLSPKRVDALVERALIRPAFPAYYFDFAKQWYAFHHKTGIQLGRLEVILEAAYGEDAQMEGSFVASFSEVLEALQQEKKGFSAAGAVKQAYTQALQKKSGFFVITVHQTREYGHDVLLLDLQNRQFISLGKSVGTAWASRQLPIE